MWDEAAPTGMSKPLVKGRQDLGTLPFGMTAQSPPKATPSDPLPASAQDSLELIADMAGHRAHLDLQINMLTERKVTKALELLAASAEGRQPAEKRELEELLKPADAEAIMGAIKRGDDEAA